VSVNVVSLSVCHFLKYFNAESAVFNEKSRENLDFKLKLSSKHISKTRIAM